jgi:hypothetical protein
MLKLFVLLSLASACSLAPASSGPAVTKADLDARGRLHIVTADGREHTIMPKKWQSGGSYGSVKISQDGESVGWLAKQMLTPLQAGANYSYAVALELDIWKRGRVIRRFSSEQAIQNWVFLNSGNEVAFTTAPLHGPEVYCTLFDVNSGRELARSATDHENNAAPDWVKQLFDGSSSR